MTASERVPDAGHPSVVAVVVAYNRKALLLESLAALRTQSAPLTAVIVVDNASDDDSAATALAFWPEIELVRLTRNTGGAGGFATGMAMAIARHDPDWVWVMDDDTIPTETALAELLVAVDQPGVVLAGSRVVWTDGSDHPMNTPRRNPFAKKEELREAAERGVTPVRSSSFVSMLVSAERVKEAGLPIADYFIWNDDFEFSTRMLRGGRGLFVPESVVVHKTKARANTDADPGARFFFEVRNKIWLMLFSHGLNPFEKAVYLGSTLLRWFRTFRSSRQRGFLFTQLRRGLVAGFRSRPRLNADALSDLGAVTEAVVKVEAPARRAA
ncbi:glycosyltransferase [Amnibacterium endophyticum]|uniref:Glycosyltransferase n=1 Tax=Amnibacterium endophyticum TaxID=2109337 RepID=A0ABW4LEN1_9MICO